MIAYRTGRRAFYVHGFAKSDRDNIDARELRELQEAAEVLLCLDASEIETGVREKRLTEVANDG